MKQTRNPVISSNLTGHPRRELPPGREQRSPWSRRRGVVPTPSYNIADIRSFFDRCAATGSPEQHGQPRQLLEYRLALVRSLARPRRTDVVLDVGCGNGHHLLALGPEVARGIGIDVSPGMIELARARLRSSAGRGNNLVFEVDDAEELKGIADQSIDLAICIGAFEHMLDKRAVLASTYRVLKFGGRFFCLAPDADYVWYRIAPLLGFATQHLSSDRVLTRGEFYALLDQAGFRCIRSAPWTFIPKGDVPALVALLLSVLDVIGRHARLDSLRGGLSVCAWKEAKPLDNERRPATKKNIVRGANSREAVALEAIALAQP